jgi:hypothetical protein
MAGRLSIKINSWRGAIVMIARSSTRHVVDSSGRAAQTLRYILGGAVTRIQRTVREFSWENIPDWHRGPLVFLFDRMGLSVVRRRFHLDPAYDLWMLLCVWVVLNHGIAPLITLSQYGWWDWQFHAMSLLERCLFYCVICYVVSRSAKTLKQLLRTFGKDIEQLPARPSLGQIRFIAYAIGCLIFSIPLAQDVVRGFRCPATLGNPAYRDMIRRGYPALLIDWATWFAYVIPACVEWFALVCFMAKNANNLVGAFLRDSAEYGPEKLKRATAMRAWFNGEVLLYFLFFIVSMIAFSTVADLYNTSSAHILAAYLVPALLMWPVIGTWSFLERYRTQALARVAAKLSQSQEAAVDLRIEYLSYGLAREPFLNWSMIVSMASVPIGSVASVRVWVLAELHPADHKIQMAIVVAIIAGLSLLYRRQVSRDRRLLQ